MKNLHYMLMALTLVLSSAMPVFAQTGAQQGNAQQSDMVTKTFKLTLYGNPPADQVVELTYATREQVERGGNEPNLSTIEICGSTPDPENSPRVSKAACKGNGTVYSATVRFPRGAQIAYRYFTGRASNFQGTFVEIAKNFHGDRPRGPNDYEKLSSDMTNSARYTFGSNQQAPSQMPATGAGGLEWLVAALTLLSVALAAGGYALRRQGQPR
jgi:hypothetical protein